MRDFNEGDKIIRGINMIYLQKYIEENSFKINKYERLPISYVLGFICLNTHKKMSFIFKRLGTYYKTNASYSNEFYQLVKKYFDIGEKNRVLGLKQEYKDLASICKFYNYNLNPLFKIDSVLDCGLEIVKKMTGIDDVNVISEEIINRLYYFSYEEFELACITYPNVYSFGINQNLFSFVIAREYLITKKEPTYKEIEKFYFSLIYYQNLLPIIFDAIPQSVKNENTIITLKLLSILKPNPYFIIKTFDDLASLDLNSLLFLTGKNIDTLLMVLNYYSEDLNKFIPDLFKEYFNSLPAEIFDILSKRETMTLDAIGGLYNVTRERIRQIEAKALLEAEEFFNKNFVVSKMNLLGVLPRFKACFDLNTYKEQLDEYNDAFRNVLKNIKFAGTAKYYKELDAIFMSEEAYDRFSRQIITTFSSHCRVSNKDVKIDECVKALSIQNISRNIFEKFVENNYKLKNNCLFHKNVFGSKRYMCDFILQKYFDDGFCYNNTKQIEEFDNYLFEEFGVKILVGVKRPQAIIERCDAVLWNRSTFIHKSKYPYVPDELNNQILNYIIEYNAPLSYGDIFKTFNKELISLGIKNKYALQGFLSKYKGELFETSKDYLAPIGSNLTTREIMKEWIMSKNEFFSYKDFEKEFKGTANSVFLSILYELGNFAHFWFKGYICIENIKISEEEKYQLDSIVEKTLEEEELGYCLIDKIYNLVLVNMKDFVVRNEMSYSYDLFSVMRLLYPTKYEYKRPMVGKIGSKFKDLYEIIDMYVINRDIIELDKFREYVNSKNSQNIANSLKMFDILKLKRDEIILVDRNLACKKELVNITDKEIKQLDEILSILLKCKEKVSIQEDIIENMYVPEMGNMENNRFLTLGVINSYLSDKYNLEIGGGYLIKNGVFFVYKNLESHK